MTINIKAGIAIPSPKAMSIISILCGLTLPVNCGSSINLPLSAVAANEIEFSSLFWRSIRYNPDFTSC